MPRPKDSASVWAKAHDANFSRRRHSEVTDLGELAPEALANARHSNLSTGAMQVQYNGSTAFM